MIKLSTLHYTILKEVIERGYAPDLNSLSKILEAAEQDVEEALYKLQDYHGVLLHPNEPKIWLIHPFSLAPTNFYIKAMSGEWWGNCAWCSLGIAALIKENLSITTRIAASDEAIIVHIKNGELQEKDLLIHFPIPMQDAWNNVMFTCSTMLIFRSEAQIDTWTARHHIPKGDIQPIQKIWELSKRWYGNHLNPDWQKWTVAEAKQIFTEFGLTHPIWALPDSNQRF